jgi:hypothetical protein
MVGPHPPGFPAEFGGIDELHVTFLIESRTRECSLQENPGISLVFHEPDIRCFCLDLFSRLRHHRRRGLKTYLGVGSVAEWLIGRCPAAA